MKKATLIASAKPNVPGVYFEQNKLFQNINPICTIIRATSYSPCNKPPNHVIIREYLLAKNFYNFSEQRKLILQKKHLEKQKEISQNLKYPISILESQFKFFSLIEKILLK
jgi:hypothetical protein